MSINKNKEVNKEMTREWAKRDWYGVFMVVAMFAVAILFSQTTLCLAEEPDIEMVRVRGGCFQMGDTIGGGKDDEKPVHEVCVSDFYIGKYEVTQAQWQPVMGSNPSKFIGDRRPVDSVSWDDAQAFIAKLNQMTGGRYRLSTEAEWEYAARSGGKAEKWAGTSEESQLRDYAWYDGNSAEKTHAVGANKPNGLGLFDMTGNVWEWCQDWYDENYYKNSPKNNPGGPSSGSMRVLRGGSWNNSPGGVRAASRIRNGPSARDYNNGFRLGLSAQ